MTSMSWSLPINLLAASVEIMRPNGLHGNEGLALWLGDERDRTARVTHILRLHGSGFVAGPLQLSLSMRAISRITDLSDELGLYWVGQIHSHPGMFVDLSRVDRAFGVKVQDYLSVVCPHYAQARTSDLNECGVHVFDEGAYRRFTQCEVATRIRIGQHKAEVLDLEVHA
jgi:hypothetical protein